MKYSDSYVCHVPNTKEALAFVEDCRKVLRGSGFGLTMYARNPNRKQFYKNDRHTYGDGYLAKHDYCQNLPRQFATSFALYFTGQNPSITMARAHGRVDAIRKIYEANKVKLTA